MIVVNPLSGSSLSPWQVKYSDVGQSKMIKFGTSEHIATRSCNVDVNKLSFDRSLGSVKLLIQRSQVQVLPGKLD